MLDSSPLKCPLYSNQTVCVNMYMYVCMYVCMYCEICSLGMSTDPVHTVERTLVRQSLPCMSGSGAVLQKPSMALYAHP